MNHQADDLTAERAAKIYAKLGRGSMPDIRTIGAALKTSRQEALREAAKVVDTVEADTDLVNFDVTIACRRIHEQLMRLASDGG